MNTRSYRLFVLLVFVALFSARSASALIYIQGAGAGSTPSGQPSGTNLTIIINNATSVVRIYTDSPSNDDIGRITVVNDGGSQQTFIVISNNILVTPPTTLPIAPGCRHWAGIDSSSRANVGLNASISGNLTKGILISKPYRIDVAGTVDGTVSGSTPITAGLNSSDPTTDMRLSAGSIITPNGRTRRIVVDGDIGTPGLPVSISMQSKPTSAQVLEFLSARNIDANISDTAPGAYFERIRATGSAGSGGDMDGSLSFQYVQYAINGAQLPTDPYGIKIAGDLLGDITFTNGVSAPFTVEGNMQAGSSITVAGSLVDRPQPPQEQQRTDRA